MLLILRSMPFYDRIVCMHPTAAAAVQDSQETACSHSCMEMHLRCSQLVLQHRPKQFRWSLQLRRRDGADAPDVNLPCTSESEAVVDIGHELLQILPLLASIGTFFGPQYKGCRV